MQPACLRIRFTPLLQNIQKEDSKHYLEIVPEINCIENLDKIQWRKEENCIEYTIPMTYKIVLRKKRVIEDDIEGAKTVDKVYHSCVDLLLPSSDTNLGLGSGDINRIASDTFVLSKVTTDVEKCSILLKEINNGNKIDDSIELTTAQVQTDINSNPSISSQLVHNNIIESAINRQRESAETQTSFEVLQSESLTQVSDTNIFDLIKRSIDKITNTDLFSTSTSTYGVRTSDTETCPRVNSKLEPARKLSLSPICSIDTDDEQPESDKDIPNTIVFRVYDSHRFASADLDGRHIKTNLFYDLHDESCEKTHYKSIKRYDSIRSHRVLPEVRVANFIKIMEKEIMPLKEMLGDIVNKCSSLGFIWNSQQNSVIYKNETNSDKNVSRCVKTKKQTKSNRVVYTIVFDG